MLEQKLYAGSASSPCISDLSERLSGRYIYELLSSYEQDLKICVDDFLTQMDKTNFSVDTNGKQCSKGEFFAEASKTLWNSAEIKKVPIIPISATSPIYI